MKPEERAEKIDKLYFDPSLVSHEEKMQLIASEIQAAVEEVEADRDRWADSAVRLEKALEKCKAEAYEDAAKMAEWICACSATVTECSPCRMAKLIRARAKEYKENL